MIFSGGEIGMGVEKKPTFKVLVEALEDAYFDVCEEFLGRREFGYPVPIEKTCCLSIRWGLYERLKDKLHELGCDGLSWYEFVKFLRAVEQYFYECIHIYWDRDPLRNWKEVPVAIRIYRSLKKKLEQHKEYYEKLSETVTPLIME